MFRSSKSFLTRLIGLTIAPPVKTSVRARHANRFRPMLEAFEDRTVPAAGIYTWIGSVSTDATDLSNWSISGASSAPGSTANLIFGSSAQRNCVGLVSTGTSFAVVTLADNFAYTASLGEDLTFGNFTLAGGAISQPDANSDLTVTGAFNWTGGTLNSSEYLSTFTITGETATGLFAPASAGTVWLGSNFSLEDGAVATMEEGTIELNKDGIELCTATRASLNFDPESGSAIFGVTRYLDGSIGSGTTWTISAGASVPFKGMITNNGTLAILPGSTITIAGKPTIAVAYGQGVGASIFLHGSSTLATAADKKVVLAGGKLATVYNSDVSSANATVKTDQFEVAGTDIYINYQGSNVHFGELLVDGDVLWTGGTFHTEVYNGGATCNVWRTTNAGGNGAQFTIAGGTIDAIFLDTDHNTGSFPFGGDSWKVLRAGGGFVDDTAPNLMDTDPDLWEMEVDPDNPAIYWKVVAK